MTDLDKDQTCKTDGDGTINVRRVLIVANPKAGGFSEAALTTIEAALIRNGLHVDTRRSAKQGDIRETVAAIGETFDVIAVHGGDGSVNEAVAGLHEISGMRPALAVIAGGTANVLALETNSGFTSSRVAQDIMDGRTTPLHYGLANGRPFVLMVSAGLDAAVVHRLPRRLKEAIGKWAYIAAVIAQKRRARTPDLLVKTAGRTIACRIAICANASRYGGDFVVAPDTHAMRAGLRLVLVKDDSLLGLLRVGWRLLARRPLDVSGVCMFGANDAEIDAMPAAPAQLDGDPFGMTPLHVTTAHSPLKLIRGGNEPDDKFIWSCGAMKPDLSSHGVASSGAASSPPAPCSARDDVSIAKSRQEHWIPKRLAGEP
jgi:diacylglycerol kinase (ATP)